MVLATAARLDQWSFRHACYLLFQIPHANIWGQGGASFDSIGRADQCNSPQVELGLARLLIWSGRFAEGRVDACECDVSRKSAVLPVLHGPLQPFVTRGDVDEIPGSW